MSKVVFFCIPAYGHTNPTIEVVRELVKMGNQVRYYSFEIFREQIEGAGAEYIGCDDYIPPLTSQEEKKIGKDFSGLLDMVFDVTMKLGDKALPELTEYKPDCIVADSMCAWGKLFAKRLQIPYICSTTTFAFNEVTARTMKRGFGELFGMLKGMPAVNKRMETLREMGYPIKNFLELIQNDNDTETIVFTSKDFQPYSETFSEKYHFVGPSVKLPEMKSEERYRKLIYISLGTVNNKNLKFYHNCIKALKSYDADVIMSVGDGTNIAEFTEIPGNFSIHNRVNQMEVLQNADVFLTHCGMNSVNESLYCCVPMVLFPQQSEQAAVASRVAELGAGSPLKKNKPTIILHTLEQVLSNASYKEHAKQLSDSFLAAGGAVAAAEAIDSFCRNEGKR